MKHRRIYLVAVIVLVLIYGVVGYFRGSADFVAIESGQTPIYAKPAFMLSDGGTHGYSGLGYTVYRMHRILLDRTQTNPVTGYLGGAKIEWGYPVRIFLRDDDSYHYIPRQ